MWPALLIIAAEIIVAVPLANDDILEPSVRNEVDHALSVSERTGAATNRTADAAAFSVAYPTNGLSRTDIALKLVSAQRSDGRWISGTNDVTAAALEVLKSL